MIGLGFGVDVVDELVDLNGQPSRSVAGNGQKTGLFGSFWLKNPVFAAFLPAIGLNFHLHDV